MMKMRRFRRTGIASFFMHIYYELRETNSENKLLATTFWCRFWRRRGLWRRFWLRLFPHRLGLRLRLFPDRLLIAILRFSSGLTGLFFRSCSFSFSTNLFKRAAVRATEDTRRDSSIQSDFIVIHLKAQFPIFKNLFGDRCFDPLITIIAKANTCVVFVKNFFSDHSRRLTFLPSLPDQQSVFVRELSSTTLQGLPRTVSSPASLAM